MSPPLFISALRSGKNLRNLTQSSEGQNLTSAFSGLQPMSHIHGKLRGALMIAAASACLAVAGCQTSAPISAIDIDRTQGSEENIGSLTAVIRNNPSDPEPYNVRGAAYGRAGEFRKAMDDFNKAIQLNPRFYQAYANRALIERSQGDLTAAANDYNQALSLNSNYDAAYIGRGNLYRQAGRNDEAFRDFNKAIQLDTTDPRAYHNRGLIYQLRGDHARAIDDFSTAISLSDSPEPYNGRGLSYVALNDDENAFADFNHAIQLDNKKAESWANQALIYERRGETQKAIRSYARAAQLDPNYGPARDGLSRLRKGS